MYAAYQNYGTVERMKYHKIDIGDDRRACFLNTVEQSSVRLILWITDGSVFYISRTRNVNKRLYVLNVISLKTLMFLSNDIFQRTEHFGIK